MCSLLNRVYAAFAAVLFAVSSVVAAPITSGLVFQFDAQDPNGNGGTSTPANNASLTGWNDLSGNGFHLSGTGSNQGGVYNTTVGAINNQNYVRFNSSGSNQYMQTGNIASTTMATGNNQASTFFVLDFDGGSNGQVFMQWNTGSQRYGWEGSNRWDFGSTSSPGVLSGWSSTLNGNFQILSGVASSGAGARSVYINGANVATGSIGGNLSGTLPVGLGSQPGSLTHTANVGFAEVLHYNRRLNLAEQQLVENYLSSKYNLAIANDRYLGDTPGNLNHDFGVVGVGRVDASNISSASAVQDGLSITATTGLGDGEFVLAGHQAGANGLGTITGGAVGDRWTRQWFLDAYNDSNVNLTLAFDFANDGLTETTASSEYSLLYSQDGANFSIFSEAFSIAGNNAEFNVNSLDLAGGFFTLGLNAQIVPEPATLALFSVVGMCGLGYAGFRRRVART